MQAFLGFFISVSISDTFIYRAFNFKDSAAFLMRLGYFVTDVVNGGTEIILLMKLAAGAATVS